MAFMPIIDNVPEFSVKSKESALPFVDYFWVARHVWGAELVLKMPFCQKKGGGMKKKGSRLGKPREQEGTTRESALPVDFHM